MADMDNLKKKGKKMNNKAQEYKGRAKQKMDDIKE
jgi:hypothetical protein